MINTNRSFHYAMRMLVLLLAGNGDHFVSISDLARRIRVSEGYLRKVALQLVRQGMLESKQGPSGGLRLLPGAKDISLGQVHDWLVGPMRQQMCPVFGIPRCPVQKECPLRKDCDWYFSGMRERFFHITLAEWERSPGCAEMLTAGAPHGPGQGE